MRGTLVQHALFGRQQTRGEQRQRGVLVAFDLDGARQPLAAFNQQCGHANIASEIDRSRVVARNRPDTRSLRAARRRIARAPPRRHRSISRRMSAAVAVPSLTMKLPCVGETRAPPTAAPLSPARSTSAPADHGMPVRHAVAARLRVLEDAAGARRVERLRPLAERQRLARRRAQRRRIARRHAERRRQQHLAGLLQPAAIVAERHRRRRHVADRRRRGRPASHVGDQVADQPAAEVRVAEDRAANRARRAGPRFEPGRAVQDRPAHQAVDRDRRVGPHAIRRPTVRTSPPRGRITRPRTPRPTRARSIRRRACDRHAGRVRRACSAVTISSLFRVSSSQSAGPPTRNVVKRRERHVALRRDPARTRPRSAIAEVAHRRTASSSAISARSCAISAASASRGVHTSNESRRPGASCPASADVGRDHRRDLRIAAGRLPIGHQQNRLARRRAPAARRAASRRR